jgi:hypothetical protein
MPNSLLNETSDSFTLVKVGADAVPRELQVRWVTDTLIGITVFVTTQYCTIALDPEEARRFARWLAGQVD